LIETLEVEDWTKEQVMVLSSEERMGIVLAVVVLVVVVGWGLDEGDHYQVRRIA
jgi:hypothetical protein